jgi:DNA-binding transcriptional ArsR family regulator
MSVRAMTWAFEADLEPLAKIVLLALADHAGDDDLAYPSVKKLATKSSTSPRTVQRRLRDLEDMGFVTVVTVGNGRKPSLYRCNIEGCQTVTPDTVDTSGASDSHPRGDTVVTHNRQLTVNEPSGYARFDEFWNVYAHKKGKDEALKVWKQNKLDAIADKVIAGAARYVETRGDNPKFWKYPQGWLSGGRWADEDTPVSKTSKTKRENQTDFLRSYVAGAEERTMKNVTSKIHSIAFDGISDNGK